MLRLFKYLTRKEWVLVLGALALIVVQVFLDLALPDYMSEITELVESADSTMGEILETGGKMLLTALGALLAAIATAWVVSLVAASFSANLRVRLFDRVQDMSAEDLRRFRTESLVTRTSNDVLQLQLAVVLGLEVLVKAPIMAVWAIVKIHGPAWTVITVAGSMLLLLLCVICIGLCMPHFRRMQDLTDDLGRITKENLSGLLTVRSLDGEQFEEARFEHANEKLTKTHLFTAHTLSVLSPAMQLVNNLLTLASYFVAVLLINAAAVEARVALFSDTVAYLSYMLRIVTAFLLVAGAATLVPRATVAAKRIRAVLELSSSLQDGALDRGLEGMQGEVELRGVGFFYPGAEEPILRDVSFTVHRGETLGVIGVSGCGKSTAVSMIPRFCDATEGEVLVNGVDVRDYRKEVLRARVGYVSQEPFLFSGTVRENIAFGDGGNGAISPKKLSALLRAVCAEDMIEALPAGLDTHITEGATNLSGGEAQRIAIARALCHDPEILILDGTFSFFSVQEGEQIRHALERYRSDLTCIIVTQRISSVRHADRIVVLDGGRVVGVGTHGQLLAECEAYQSIAGAQGEEVSAHA